MVKMISPKVTWIIVALAVQPGVMPGQSKSGARTNVLTVCEVLSNLGQNADAMVAVVGKFEESASLTDHYDFLSQDACERPVIVGGKVWPNKILMEATNEGVPKPPSDKPRLNQRAVRAKLALVRKSTKLGVHNEPRFDKQTHSLVLVDVPDEWVIAYGRMVSAPKFGREDCGDDCNGFLGAPLAIVVEPLNVYGLNADGSFIKEAEAEKR